MAKEADFEPVESFELVGGRPCLDFTNTIGSFFLPEIRDKIGSYRDLLVFARRTDVIGEHVERALVQEAKKRPADAERVVSAARQLRRALFTLFYPDRSNREEALVVLNRFVARARARQVLEPEAAGFAFSFRADDLDLERPLWPLAISAAELLTSPLLERVHACSSGASCTWLFVDESKNHSRRWCSMRDCGNRVKAKRHYEKKRAG